jgi:hypothetical protein
MVLGLTLAVPPAARADDRAVLLLLLRDGDSFRVRARAALSLAGHGGDEAVIGALEAALRDPHAAVRAAAAGALAQVGTRRSVPALRLAAADPTELVAGRAKLALRRIAVRTGTRPFDEPPSAPQTPRTKPALAGARYAVVLGEMRNRTPVAGLDLSTLLGQQVAEQLRGLERVAVFTPAELTESALRELRRRKLPSFRIEATLDCVDGGVSAGEHTMRCRASLLLMDEPGRTIRSSMRGAASGREQVRADRNAQLQVLARKTLRGAVRSALATGLPAIGATARNSDANLHEVQTEAALDR